MKTIQASAKEWLRVEKEFATETLPLASVAISMSELRAIREALKLLDAYPKLIRDVEGVIMELENEL